MTRYWVDANVFIGGNRDIYPIDEFRPYWNWFESMMEAGSIVTHKKVAAEVMEGLNFDKPDPIAVWVKARKNKGLNYSCTEESKVLAGRICEWAISHYGFKTANKFLDGADPLLMARAFVDGGKVVTQESANKEPRIPKVCAHFGIDWVTIGKMNQELKMKLKWK